MRVIISPARSLPGQQKPWLCPPPPIPSIPSPVLEELQPGSGHFAAPPEMPAPQQHPALPGGPSPPCAPPAPRVGNEGGWGGRFRNWGIDFLFFFSPLGAKSWGGERVISHLRDEGMVQLHSLPPHPGVPPTPVTSSTPCTLRGGGVCVLYMH